MVHLEAKETVPIDLEENCNLENQNQKLKKKNKKRSNVASLSPISPFYEQALSSFPIKLNNTKAKGRHAVAVKDLEEGTTVCQEQAVAFVVRSDYLDQHCHVCLSDLSEKMMCSECKNVFYCSNECLEKDNEMHLLVCQVFNQINTIGRATDVDPDLLRLMVLLMARKYLDEKEEERDSLKRSTPYWCVEDLISHKESAEASFIQVLTQASERLLFEMPEKLHFSVEDMVTLACRINSNAHGLGDNYSRNTDVALGLFPLGALFFNHSCNPNTTFIGVRNGQLAFRTLRPVKKDEELVVSYIDLYSDRDERRQDLLTSKHFWCKCKRCSSPMERSVDRFLQGVNCMECEKDVYMIPPTPIEHLSKGRRNLYMDTTTNFQCSLCNHKVKKDIVCKPIEKANKEYMLAMAAIRQERNYRKGGEKLSQLVKTDSKKAGNLHMLNSYKFNSLIPLMNCQRYNGDLKGAIETNKTILYMMEQYSEQGSLPANTSEISDFWQNLGELSMKVMNELKGRSSVLEKKWRNEAKDAFSKALAVRRVVFGKDHPKSQHIEYCISML
ncbi:uncharacterized protein BX663DRAFT_426846 [Cokeromyces recurvatus]|uniref:uncharacterized protein n=1 Tax=Cokeromyces recurvatus TaxID=90255 RepID=UPI0022204B27|nr:uncharacterized protein BX663DRAFT_426846 [Cokeromyces recurvatus]KAI7907390.1 hypothetical protein BX663DRAFT_426846 [Cokeromyces recurvatus]